MLRMFRSELLGTGNFHLKFLNKRDVFNPYFFRSILSRSCENYLSREKPFLPINNFLLDNSRHNWSDMSKKKYFLVITGVILSVGLEITVCNVI